MERTKEEEDKALKRVLKMRKTLMFNVHAILNPILKIESLAYFVSTANILNFFGIIIQVFTTEITVHGLPVVEGLNLALVIACFAFIMSVLAFTTVSTRKKEDEN